MIKYKVNISKENNSGQTFSFWNMRHKKNKGLFARRRGSPRSKTCFLYHCGNPDDILKIQNYPTFYQEWPFWCCIDWTKYKIKQITRKLEAAIKNSYKLLLYKKSLSYLIPGRRNPQAKKYFNCIIEIYCSNSQLSHPFPARTTNFL